MGICSDRSVNYLKSLNLNVILHPLEDLAPLALLGEYGDARGIIGTLSQLTEAHDGCPPANHVGRGRQYQWAEE
ncbi:hypothetical protein [Novosphingobium sp.]|uniref:hypothetical protein n=1 Tax=Novosphingobium sp. TaxID=1874826 RepID=UPI002FDD538A